MEVPVYAMPDGGVGTQVGKLVIDDNMRHLLDDPAMTFYGEDVGLTDSGIHIQSFTADPDRVPDGLPNATEETWGAKIKLDIGGFGRKPISEAEGRARIVKVINKKLAKADREPVTEQDVDWWRHGDWLQGGVVA